MPSPFSELALRALGVFGLTTDDAHAESNARVALAHRRARALDQSLRPGGLALLSGPSASGKSTILRALAELVPAHDRVYAGAAPALPIHASVIDSLAPTPADLPRALRSLSAAGLADAFIPARPVATLSAGECARLNIARAVQRAEALIAEDGSPTIILDDFADALDDATALAVSHALRRWLTRNSRSRLVIATVRANIAHALRPDLAIELPGGPALGTPALRAGRMDFSQPQSVPPSPHPLVRRATTECRNARLGEPGHPRPGYPESTITIGAAADYELLAHLHYRAARPATIARVLVARQCSSPIPIAVLVVSMPTLNGAWRNLAWPGEYANRARHAPLCKRTLAHAINRDLRCISRLIVDPLHRARGLASALVRAYLAEPLTSRTECPSAMGVASPVFLRAGMREWLIAPARRDLTLIDALNAADLAPWMLADISLALDRLAQHPHLERSLRVWANAHGPTRPLAGAPTRELIRAAAKHIIAPRRAYTAG